jgi:hypothetical protein
MTQFERLEQYSGHAGIGKIMGTRTENGDVPEHVRIAYRTTDSVAITVVQASPKSMTTEKTPGDSIKLTRPSGSRFSVDAVLATEPVSDL